VDQEIKRTGKIVYEIFLNVIPHSETRCDQEVISKRRHYHLLKRKEVILCLSLKTLTKLKSNLKL